MNYTVHQLAELAGVSTRTLHYYDEIHLLSPSRKQNGYRSYSEEDLLQLQQILFYRELDLPLEEIRNILNDASFSMADALHEHRTEIEKRKRRLESLLRTIDKTLGKLTEDAEMSDNELFEAFWKKHTEDYAEEVETLWGHTDAFMQSKERTAHMTKADFKRIAKEGDALMQQIAACIECKPESPEVQELIARHYDNLRTFYDPSPELYRGLAQMYCEDVHFRAYYERYHPELPAFMRKAMEAYCKALERN